MPLPEYKNLTQSELEMADHYAEIGDMSVLRQYQQLSASREGGSIERSTYDNPMRPRKL